MNDKAKPYGDLKVTKYKSYYDFNNTITTAQVTNPNDPDNANYNQERIFDFLGRNADKIYVSNDGKDTLYIIVGHEGEGSFSRERPVYPGEVKPYFNVYDLRLRSPTAGLSYRVSEYPIRCRSGISGSSSGFSAIEKSVLHNEALPLANTDWLATDLTPSSTPTTFRIQVAVSIAGNFNVIITNGGNSQTITLNSISGPALIAGGLYTFDILVHDGDTINFQYSTTTGTIQNLRVQEIDAVTA